MAALKYIYMTSGMLIWAFGCAAFIIGMRNANWNYDGLWIMTVMGFLVVTFFSIYSFLYGAQPGHIIRFLFIVLSALFGFLTCINNFGYFTGVSYQLTLYTIAGTMVWISMKYRGQFIKEYKEKGRTDYFEIYFKPRRPHT